MRFQLFLLSLLLVVTGCSYRSGSLLEAPDSKTRAARRRGCIDVAVTLADDARVPKPSVLLLYAFGNRCEHPETFDIARVVVTGVTADGARIELATHDPSGAFHPEMMESDAEGKELVRYDAPKHEGKAATDVASFEKVCVDLRRVVDAQEDASEICLAPPGDPRALVDNDVQHKSLDGAGFGWGWSHVPFPRIRFDIGVSGYSVGTEETRLSSPRIGTVNAKDAFGARRVGGATLDLRITGFVGDRVYVGGEFSGGGGPGRGGVVKGSESGDVPVLTERSNFQISTGAIVGVAIDRIGPMQPRVEIFGGGRLLLAHAQTDECKGSSCRNLVGLQGVVMPRVGLDFWVNPFMTIGPWAGLDLVNQGDFAAGLTFAIHGRTYDGRR